MLEYQENKVESFSSLCGVAQNNVSRSTGQAHSIFGDSSGEDMIFMQSFLFVVWLLQSNDSNWAFSSSFFNINEVVLFS